MKTKFTPKKLLTIFISLIMILVLVLMILYSSVWSVDKKHRVNSRVSTLNLMVYDSSMNHYMSENIYGNNSKMYILYFYDSINEEELNNVASCYFSGIEIYVISSFENYEENYNSIVNNKNIDSSHFTFAYDSSEKEALVSFEDEASYPFYVWSDKNCIVKYTSNTDILSQSEAIEATYNGKTVGYEVGNYCYTRNITKIKLNSDETELVEDGKFNLKNNIGKVSVINFWGYWCTPCKAELPHFNEVAKKYGSSLEIIAIHQGSTYLSNYDLDQAYDYISGNSDYVITWAHDDASDSYYKMLGGTSTYPITLIIDQEGNVAFSRIGSLSYDELDKEVSKLIK